MGATGYQRSSVPVLVDATAAGTYGENVQPAHDVRTFQCYGVTSAGAGSATVKVWGSNIASPVNSTDVDWVLLGTMTLTLSTARSSDYLSSDATWRWVRAELDAVSGTGATVQCAMGV